MKTYEKHQREYTVVGATTFLAAMVGKKVNNFFNSQLSEVLSVVKDKVYYHFQVEGERQEMAKYFMQRVKKDEIDLEKEYQEFDKLTSEYENLISQEEKFFNKDTILKFFKYYEDLAPVALASIDAVEAIE